MLKELSKFLLEAKAMRKQPAFSSAHALRDGTIWCAFSARKPRNHPDIDPEGTTPADT
jgi:hypothetical protein